MTAPMMLGPGDVGERRFAHPDHIAADKAVLCMLLRDFHRVVASRRSPGPVVLHTPSRDDWHRRVVIPDATRVGGLARITVVGFFGRVRDDVAPDIAEEIAAAGAALAEEVLVTPGAVGYTTHLLADERNYANLVLVDSPDVIAMWRKNVAHAGVAAIVAPQYYEHVRIYNGSIARRDLAREGAVHLDAVKYWDYRTNPVWHAVRSLS